MALRKLSRQLLEKSENAFLLALEIYNKPTVHYRLESFCILFINAWELMLKAKIIEDHKSTKPIFAKGTKQKDTITFSEALGRVLSNTKDPIRINLEHINDLRNTSSHLIVAEYETIYAGLFQQGVLNYTKSLYEWFEKSIDITPRLLTLAFEFHPSSVTKLTIKDKYNEMISTAFSNKQKTVMQTLKELPQGYCIPINSTLALVTNPKNADIVLSKGHDGKEMGFVHVAKDHDKTHPYLSGVGKTPKDNTVLKILHDHGYTVTSFDIQSINFAENINEISRTEFVYKSKVAKSSSQYSPEYIQYILKKMANNPNFLSICREKYKKSRS